MEKDSGYIGRVVGNYTIIRELGHGSFGSVYLGNHRHLNRTVAIKILHANFSHSLKERDVFFQEAQFLDELKHPHILPLLDVGEQDDFIYMMLEYAPDSLQVRMAKHFPSRLPMKETFLILSQIGQALQYAHAYKRPVVHRDVKPSNILFNDKGDALLADFGIAIELQGERTEDVGDIVGSFPYMAPEQFDGQVSVKSDQYALACIAYELLTGRKPIPGPHIMTSDAWMIWSQKHKQDEVVRPRTLNPDIAGHVEEALLKALQKERTQRHMSIAAFITQMTSDTRLLDLAELPTFVQPVAALQSLAALGNLPEPVPEIIPAVVRKTSEQWMAEGNSFYRERRFEEAVDAYEQAIQQGYRDAQMFYSLGNVLRELKKLEEALDAYGNAIELNPSNDLFYNSRGSVLYELKRYDTALKAYKQAIQLAPHKAIFYNNQADVLKDLENYEGAFDAYEQALKLANSNILMVKASLGKGDMLLRLKKREEALKVYEQVARIDPSNAVAHTVRGDILWGLRRNEEALRAYEQAIRLIPKDRDLYYKKRSTLLALGRVKDAQQVYEIIQRMNKDMQQENA